MNISGPAAVAKPEMLFYAPGDLTVTPLSLSSPICQNWNVAARYLERVLKSTDFRTLHNFPAIEGHTLFLPMTFLLIRT